jgi:hypothetical protein
MLGRCETRSQDFALGPGKLYNNFDFKIKNLGYGGEDRMLNKKTIGIILLVVGVVLVVVSLTADMIGIGATAGFGYKQIAGSIVGVLLTVAGFVMMSRK